MFAFALLPSLTAQRERTGERFFFRADSQAVRQFERYGPARPAAHGKVPASDYPALAERLVTRMENDGYPFAAVSLSPLTEPDSDGVVSTLTVEAGPLVRYDSVIVKGSLKLRPRFLQAFLNWRPRRKYMERNACRIAQKMSALPYAEITREPGVEFVGDKAYLYLFADKRKVNRFDGYLGLVPVSETTGRVMFTGEVNLMLQNVFKIGETLELRWQAPEKYSQCSPTPISPTGSAHPSDFPVISSSTRRIRPTST